MRQGPFVRLDTSPYSFYRESNKWSRLPPSVPSLASIPLRLSTTAMAFRRHDAINLEHFLSASSSSASSFSSRVIVVGEREGLSSRVLRILSFTKVIGIGWRMSLGDDEV